MDHLHVLHEASSRFPKHTSLKRSTLPSTTFAEIEVSNSLSGLAPKNKINTARDSANHLFAPLVTEIITLLPILHLLQS